MATTEALLRSYLTPHLTPGIGSGMPVDVGPAVAQRLDETGEVVAAPGARYDASIGETGVVNALAVNFPGKLPTGIACEPDHDRAILPARSAMDMRHEHTRPFTEPYAICCDSIKVVILQSEIAARVRRDRYRDFGISGQIGAELLIDLLPATAIPARVNNRIPLRNAHKPYDFISPPCIQALHIAGTLEFVIDPGCQQARSAPASIIQARARLKGG
jgi:hypothetical protein